MIQRNYQDRKHLFDAVWNGDEQTFDTGDQQVIANNDQLS